MIVQDIMNYLNNLYPQTLASSFDSGKLGLEFGNPRYSCKKVLITLDVTLGVVQEAIEEKCDLIITHHPFIFNPLLKLDYNSVLGQKIELLIQNKISVFAMHTNFDSGVGGMNDILANLLELNEIHSVASDTQADAFLRVGTIHSMKLVDFAIYAKEKLQEKSIRVVGDFNQMIHKVGIIGGSGAMDWPLAQFHGCDCLITGEVRHNNALDADRKSVV